MAEKVEYILSLKDEFSKGISAAEEKVKGLEHGLESVKGILTGIGIAAAGFEIAEFVKESAESWEKMEFAMSQVEAGLKSTKEAAGLTFDEIKQGAESMAHNFKFSQASILDMQSILLTFPSVTKETFGTASNIILDMSTRLGQDLKSSAIQVGKALQDPEKGITALRRVGVNFNAEQTEIIKTLAATGHAAEAQTMILKELETEFGGSAKAAAEADKGFRLEKTMEENKVALGEIIDKIHEELMPVLIEVAKGFGNLIHWVKENGKELWALIKAVGEGIIAFKTITTFIVPLVEGFAAVAPAAAGAVGGIEAVGVASTVALGPLGLLAAALAGAIALYSEIEDHEKQMADVKEKNLNDQYETEKKNIEEMTAIYEKQGMKREEASKHAAEVELKNINETYDLLYKQWALLDKGAPGEEDLDEQLQGLQKDREAAQAIQKSGLAPSTEAKKIGKNSAVVDTPKDSSKAVGSKAVTINIQIGKLIESFKISATNVTESTGKVKELVAQTLLSAVNDSQIVAGI